MACLTIGSFEEFAEYQGKHLGYSDYFKITQEQINQFAEATIDHQWIHTDPEKAKNEGPFKSTIAHGYLTVSMLPYLWEQVVEFNNIKMMVNYGMNNLKFNQPVLVDQEIRLKAHCTEIKNLRGTTKVILKAVMEIKDNPKPAFEADIIFLYHFG